MVEKLREGSRERLQELNPRAALPGPWALGQPSQRGPQPPAGCAVVSPLPLDALPGKSGRPGHFSRLLSWRTQLRSGWAGRACGEAASPARAEGPATGLLLHQGTPGALASPSRWGRRPGPAGERRRCVGPAAGRHGRRGRGLHRGGVRGLWAAPWPPGRGLHGGGVRGPRLQPGCLVDGGLRAGFIPSGALPLGRRKGLSAGVFIFSADVNIARKFMENCSSYWWLIFPQ